MKKEICEKCKNRIEVAVTASSHDIFITDTEHSDNSITITKYEARFVIKEIERLLKEE